MKVFVFPGNKHRRCQPLRKNTTPLSDWPSAPVTLRRAVQWEREAGDTNWQPPCCIPGVQEERRPGSKHGR